MPPILYLIDGHALAYRTYYALTAGGSGRWQTQSGEPTAGVYGFASVLMRLLEQERPEYLAVAFDTGKTFRDDLFPQYKATRAKMPDDLRPQMERIRQMVDAFHLPRLEVEGYEADDVLGSIARQAVAKGFGVKIITGDRDLLQLIDDRIIVNLAGAKISEARDYTPEEVVVYLGVRPDQIIDYKALVGDTSDNIPGVAGIGQKTAVSLLQTYRDLDDIYAHLDELPARLRTRLEEGRDSAYLSRDLATIRTDVKITLDLEQARTSHIDLTAVEALFHQLEFRSLTARLKNMGFVSELPQSSQQLSLFDQKITHIGEAPEHLPVVHLVNQPQALAELERALAAARVIALDTETTSTNAVQAELVGISLAVKEGEGYYLPVGHRTGEAQLPLETVLQALAPYLSDPDHEIVGHNLKYDYLILSRHGLDPAPPAFDTMIAEWLVNPSSHNLGLKDMAEAYLNIQMTHIEQLIGKGKTQRSMAEVPLEAAAAYAAADAEVSLQLVPILRQHLEKQNAAQVFHQVELPLIPVLVAMEKTGITLDVPHFKKMAANFSHRLAEIEQQIFETVGYTFNLNSTQQLSQVLFDTLRLPPPDRRRKTASGHYSTSADVLEDLRGQHPVVDYVLEYRELAKLKSTYVDALPLQVNPASGRVHTSFNQTGSVTGRLASSDPNLQNIPTRTEIGRQVRDGFIASPGEVLLSVDYSQIELRIVAHMSGDQAMLAAFRAGQDIHAATAAAIYGIGLDQVSKEQRRHAKAINFGLIYGMSPFGLSRSTGLTLAEAEDFVKAYFHQFPQVKQFLDQLRQRAASQGYVETLLGRRRYFPNLQNLSGNTNLRGREEREAINAPVQGTAADIMKLAMIHLPAALAREKLAARLLLQVHDELLLECPREELPRTAAVVQEVMENAYHITIPLKTEASWGINWGNLNPLA